MSADRLVYRGRFAPSPTGPLHFGSIVTALGSFLQARSSQGLWFVRIEDIDIPRTRPGAMDDILRTLENLGLCWDGTPLIQSQRTDSYAAVLHELVGRDLIYPCICPRRETKGRPYNGACRSKTGAGKKKNTSLRLKLGDGVTGFIDGIQGRFQQCHATDIGDFIVRRADGMHAYHLAVVIDDQEQGITGIVRGADLLDATPRQIYLQQLLHYSTPAYSHLPIATNRQGLKISKQNHASRINYADGVKVLWQALQFLGQNPEDDLLETGIEEIINWGIKYWDLARVPKQTAIPI